LRRNRPVLDGKQRVLERGNGIDPGQLLGDRNFNDGFREVLEIFVQRRGDRRGIAVGDVIAIAQGHRKGNANADIMGSTCNAVRLVDKSRHALRVVAVIDGSDAASGIASKRDRRTQIGVNARFMSKEGKPELERLIRHSNRKRALTAPMIVRIDERGHQQ
jgi:hypothetical protein